VGCSSPATGRAPRRRSGTCGEVTWWCGSAGGLGHERRGREDSKSGKERRSIIMASSGETLRWSALWPLRTRFPGTPLQQRVLTAGPLPRPRSPAVEERPTGPPHHWPGPASANSTGTPPGCSIGSPVFGFHSRPAAEPQETTELRAPVRLRARLLSALPPHVVDQRPEHSRPAPGSRTNLFLCLLTERGLQGLAWPERAHQPGEGLTTLPQRGSREEAGVGHDRVHDVRMIRGVLDHGPQCTASELRP
jgi:hypothetical protein